MDDQRDLAWKAVSLLAAVGAATAARKALAAGWRSATGREVPENPADRHTPWGPALAWAAVTGAVIGLARLVADRWAAEAWERVVGEAPPGIDSRTTVLGTGHGPFED